MQLKNSTFSSPAARRDSAPRPRGMLVDGGGNVVIADLKEAEGQALAARARRGRAFREDRRHRRGERQGRGGRGASNRSAALHGLVNCAGIVHGEKVVGKEGPHALASFARTININLIGSFNMTGSRPTSMRARRAERRRRARRDRLHRIGRGL